jgi:hypothetical protein
MYSICTNCAWAADQNYDELPFFDAGGGAKIQTWSRLTLMDEAKPGGVVPEILSGVQPPNAVFDTFFNDKMFPLFAQWRDIKGTGGKMYSPFVDGPGGIVSPARMRGLFKSGFAVKATNTVVRQHLNDITLKKMDEIASGNFHPYCRANAMIMIADLNEAEPDRPYKPAAPVLLKAVTAPTSVDAVRVEALRGLVRQARAGITGDLRGQVLNAMLALQAQRTPPEGRSQDGHDWISRRAIDVLEAMGDPGPNAAVLNGLMKTVEDQSASLAVRTTAAHALASINYAPPQNFNAAKWIEALGRLAIDCYKGELANAASQHTPIVADRLKQQLTEVRTGLAGPDGTKGLLGLSAAIKPNQDLARLLVTQIDNLIAKCATPSLPATPPSTTTPPGLSDVYMILPADPQKPLADAIQKAGEELEAALKRGPAAPAPAPAGTGAPGGAPAGQAPF